MDALTASILLFCFVLNIAVVVFCKTVWRQNTDTIKQLKKTIGAITQDDNLEILTSEFVDRKIGDYEWLTAEDVMDMYEWDFDTLRQHIEKGLVCYIKKTNGGKRFLDKERDLINLDIWAESPTEDCDDDNYIDIKPWDQPGEMIAGWLFKVRDIKRYKDIEKVKKYIKKDIDKYIEGIV